MENKALGETTPQKSSSNDEQQNTQTPSNNNDKQVVLYDPKSALQNQAFTQPQHQSQPQREPGEGSNPGRPRVLLKVGAYSVQCAECFKWRLVPTKEKYEHIRENIKDEPFFCDMAQEWKENSCCDDPPDIQQDDTRLWAMDKPSIAQPPPGWVRELRFRAQGCSKLADVYYISPLGKRLRSTVEIQKYLDEHPEFISQGVTLSRFSFQIPKPLQQDYVRKRAPSGTPRPPQSIEATPLSWVPPTDTTIFQLARTDEITPAEKKARPSTEHTEKSSPLKLSPHNVKVEGPHPPNGVYEV